MSLVVELGALEGEAAKPVFRASAGTVEFFVEFDSSALQKLAFGPGPPEDWRAAIETQRGRIRIAVQELYDGGFLAGEPRPRLFLTALDLA
jgi:hypothetical protein